MTTAKIRRLTPEEAEAASWVSYPPRWRPVVTVTGWWPLQLLARWRVDAERTITVWGSPRMVWKTWHVTPQLRGVSLEPLLEAQEGDSHG